MSRKLRKPQASDISRKPKGNKNGKPKMELELRVRRIHRRDLNLVWEFLKRVFRDVTAKQLNTSVLV